MDFQNRYIYLINYNLKKTVRYILTSILVDITKNTKYEFQRNVFLQLKEYRMQLLIQQPQILF